jgi:hypothetical protein
MVFAHQIRKVVADYLSQKLDLDGFVRDFAPLSFNVLKNGDNAAVRLANGVEAFLAELRCGCIREKQFQSMLRELAALDAPNTFLYDLSFASAVNVYPQAEFAFPEVWGSAGTLCETVPGSVALHQP